FEGALDAEALAYASAIEGGGRVPGKQSPGKGKRSERVRGAHAEIVVRGADADVVEPFVDHVAVPIAHRTVRRGSHAAHRGIGQLVLLVAIRAPYVRGSARPVVEKVRAEQGQPADGCGCDVGPRIQRGIGRGRMVA